MPNKPLYHALETIETTQGCSYLYAEKVEGKKIE